MSTLGAIDCGDPYTEEIDRLYELLETVEVLASTALYVTTPDRPADPHLRKVMGELCLLARRRHLEDADDEDRLVRTLRIARARYGRRE